MLNPHRRAAEAAAMPELHNMQVLLLSSERQAATHTSPPCGRHHYALQLHKNHATQNADSRIPFPA
jgi:hypothetical protein